jgi:hypothetical protein
MADYEEKLRPLLDEAFGPGLPVLYSELGVETRIPPRRRRLYEGEEPATPVDEATQADYYRVRSSSRPARRTSAACCSSTRTTSRR